MKTTIEELGKVGERATTMARAFNVRRGFASQDDQLPERFFEPMRAGTLKGHAIDRGAFVKSLKLYYGMMVWNSDGVPTEAKLEALNLGWIWEVMRVELTEQ